MEVVITGTQGQGASLQAAQRAPERGIEKDKVWIQGHLISQQSSLSLTGWTTCARCTCCSAALDALLIFCLSHEWEADFSPRCPGMYLQPTDGDCCVKGQECVEFNLTCPCEDLKTKSHEHQGRHVHLNSRLGRALFGGLGRLVNKLTSKLCSQMNADG